jgi:SAM-dependent methyltransferase
MSEKQPTGERFLPEVGGKIALEHWHRYQLATRLVSNKAVLDIACGEGYGSAFLAQTASSVIGIDIDEETITAAQARYAAPNLRFQTGDCTQLPLPDACMDVIVSFETIEHHDQHEAMLLEFRRVLRPEGCLLLSSPDRAVYSEKEGHQNPFHVKELDRAELLTLLGGFFPSVQLWGQRAQTVSLIAREQATTPLHWESAPPAWEYLLALCSHEPLPMELLPESVYCLQDDPLRTLEQSYLSLEQSYLALEKHYLSREQSYLALEKHYLSREAAYQEQESQLQAREQEFQQLAEARDTLEQRFLTLEAQARAWWADSQTLKALRESRTFAWAKRFASYQKEKDLWQ